MSGVIRIAPPAKAMIPTFAVTENTTLPMTLPTPIAGAPRRAGSVVRKMSSRESTSVAIVAPKTVPLIAKVSRMPSVPSVMAQAPTTRPISARSASRSSTHPGRLIDFAWPTSPVS